MCAFAHRTHSIQSRDPQGRGKIPVRASACRCFLKLKTQSLGHCCCPFKKRDGTRSSFHWRPIQSARYLQPASPVDRAQRAETPVHPLRILRLGDADVKLRPGLRRHHVGPGTAADHPRVDRNSPGQIGKTAGPLNLSPEFQHRAGTWAKSTPLWAATPCTSKR